MNCYASFCGTANHGRFLVNAGSLAVTWSEKMLGMLKHMREFNLYDQLMVLVDTKYQRLSDRDYAWDIAYNDALLSLQMLIKEAHDGKTEVEGIFTALFKVLSCSFFL